ncbi:MAG: 2-hydroxyacid dehydrogenase [Bacteroidales bacterium]|jgi:D-lactate dehydrogenase|nr:2-hydroxyacid dehydrogenase [Bacteroidales bacterium]MDD3166012.1 2-hydroxyacid dehydrogenase [Bacteroidales bacterium]MDD4769955.1 2-hydroxyacid dehydrogenase [Bacteroidales bacterium]HKL91887.1 2-hydroxyacid dehydrogenase [Bacteroidales bacterium]
MKVAVFSTKSYDREYLDKYLQEKHTVEYFESALKQRTVGLTNGFDAVCVFVNDTLDAEVIKRISENGVRLIVLRCAGFNNVDLEAAREYGMRVLRVPAYSPHAVAEHAVALIMTLNRKTHKAYNRVREGNFSIERLTGFELSGKTVGVIGTGRIGKIFAEIMRGFGCQIIAHDAYINADLEKQGVQYMDMETVFKQSDILSLHCPLTPETHHMINAESLLKMKKGVMLINTSRGKLIDTNAAIQSLKDGHLGYMGLDVYEQEEALFFKDLSEIIIRDDKIARLMTFHNVLITAHQAYFTDNALDQIAKTTCKNIDDFCAGSIQKENEVTAERVLG